MNQRSLEVFIETVKKNWGPLSTETVTQCKEFLEDLARNPDTDIWLTDALNDSPSGKALYRDPENGFVLFAYTETLGQYRVPHDHGSGWVVYAVQSGEMEMGTYSRVVDQKGKLFLVKRETYRMNPGECKIFLPKDIHHTRCLSEKLTILRFISCDLKKEDREGRMIRYEE
jgi:hypothetical protein